jgi:hypothetical protein
MFPTQAKCSSALSNRAAFFHYTRHCINGVELLHKVCEQIDIGSVREPETAL